MYASPRSAPPLSRLTGLSRLLRVQPRAQLQIPLAGHLVLQLRVPEALDLEPSQPLPRLYLDPADGHCRRGLVASAAQLQRGDRLWLQHRGWRVAFELLATAGVEAVGGPPRLSLARGRAFAAELVLEGCWRARQVATMRG